MSHASHTAGTDSRCVECRSLAYEPSWYAALMAFEPPAITMVDDLAVARV